jgi:hypothetical protein
MRLKPRASPGNDRGVNLMDSCYVLELHQALGRKDQVGG